MKILYSIIIFLFSFLSSIYPQQKDSIKFQIPDVDTLGISIEELREHKLIVEESPFIFKSEIPPSFVGGNSAMNSFFKKEIRYPRDIKKGKLEGIVIVQFAVLRNGSIDKIEIFQHLSPKCDKEALRLVKKMPPWSSFITGGMKVAGYQKIGIYFGNKDIDIVKRLDAQIKNIFVDEWESYVFEY